MSIIGLNVVFVCIFIQSVSFVLVSKRLDGLHVSDCCFKLIYAMNMFVCLFVCLFVCSLVCLFVCFSLVLFLFLAMSNSGKTTFIKKLLEMAPRVFTESPSRFIYF